MYTYVYICLTATRYDINTGGALELSGNKMSFTLDKETGNPVGLKTYPIYETNNVVEEYMLLANFLVAQKLINGVHDRAFIRNHPPPDLRKLKQVAMALEEGLNVKLFAGGSVSSNSMQESLEEVKRMQDSDLFVVVKELLKSPMKLAQYIVAADFTKSEWRHFGLNIPYYTHFTRLVGGFFRALSFFSNFSAFF